MICRNVTEIWLSPTVHTLLTPGSGPRRALLQKAKRAKLRFRLGPVPTMASSLSGVKTQAGVRRCSVLGLARKSSHVHLGDTSLCFPVSSAPWGSHRPRARRGLEP